MAPGSMTVSVMYSGNQSEAFGRSVIRKAERLGGSVNYESIPSNIDGVKRTVYHIEIPPRTHEYFVSWLKNRQW